MSGATVEINQLNKHAVWDFWQALELAAPDEIAALVGTLMSDQVAWHGPAPLGDLRGGSAFVSDFWLPLLHSFPDLKRQTHLFLGGESNGRVDGDIALDGHLWVSGTGYFHGTFARDYLGIPATGETVSIRWGEFSRMEDGKILEVYFLLDLVDLMQQAGYDVLPPARGENNLYAPPSEKDGVLLDVQDEVVSAYSLDHIRRFIFDGLNAYNESELGSMGMADYFHPDIKWYGPGGIGACLSFREFEELHQAPWLIAFPDRKVQNLDALIAEDSYSGGPGWAGVTATHSGPYLGSPATGNTIRVNGLDWWKRDGEVYIENWVFVDMIDLFRQFGIDLFARLADQISARR